MKGGFPSDADEFGQWSDEQAKKVPEYIIEAGNFWGDLLKEVGQVTKQTLRPPSGGGGWAGAIRVVPAPQMPASQDRQDDADCADLVAATNKLVVTTAVQSQILQATLFGIVSGLGSISGNLATLNATLLNTLPTRKQTLGLWSDTNQQIYEHGNAVGNLLAEWIRWTHGEYPDDPQRPALAPTKVEDLENKKVSAYDIIYEAIKKVVD